MLTVAIGTFLTIACGQPIEKLPPASAIATVIPETTQSVAETPAQTTLPTAALESAKPDTGIPDMDTEPFSLREEYLVAYAIFAHKTGETAVDESGEPIEEYWKYPDSVWMPYAEPYLLDTGGSLLNYWIAFVENQLPYDPIEWAEIAPFTTPLGYSYYDMVFHSTSGSVYVVSSFVVFKDGEEFLIIYQ